MIVYHCHCLCHRPHQWYPMSLGSKPDGVSDGGALSPTVTKVSDAGVKDLLMDVRDVVVAPFAGSRAPQVGFAISFLGGGTLTFYSFAEPR
jgi:hypothetical protein